MDEGAKVLRGPFTVVGLLVAAAWIALGGFAAVLMSSPWNVVIPIAGLGAAIATTWVSLGLQVRLSGTGVSAPGIPEIAWEDIDHVGVRNGIVCVPYLVVQRGRALDELPLEGIAGMGSNMAVRLAHRISKAGNLGEVAVEGARVSGGGRRGLAG